MLVTSHASLAIAPRPLTVLECFQRAAHRDEHDLQAVECDHARTNPRWFLQYGVDDDVIPGAGNRGTGCIEPGEQTGQVASKRSVLEKHRGQLMKERIERYV